MGSVGAVDVELRVDGKVPCALSVVRSLRVVAVRLETTSAVPVGTLADAGAAN